MGITAGIAVFIGINVKIIKQAGKYGQVNAKFLAISLDFMRIEGIVAGTALVENTTKEDVLFLTVFVSTIALAFSYEIGHFASKTIKSKEPEQNAFRFAYESAKTQSILIKNTSLMEYSSRLELFVKEFEKNDKQRKTTKTSTT